MSWIDDLSGQIDSGEAEPAPVDTNAWLHPEGLETTSQLLSELIDQFGFEVFQVSDEDCSVRPDVSDDEREWIPSLRRAHRFDRDSSSSDPEFVGLDDEEFLEVLYGQWTSPQKLGYASSETELGLMMYRGSTWVCKWDAERYTNRDDDQHDSLSWTAVCAYLIYQKAEHLPIANQNSIQQLTAKIAGSPPEGSGGSDVDEDFSLRLREYYPWNESVTLTIGASNVEISISESGELEDSFSPDLGDVFVGAMTSFSADPPLISVSTESDRTLFLAGGSFVVVDGLTAEHRADRGVVEQVQSQIAATMLDPWRRSPEYRRALTFWRETLSDLDSNVDSLFEGLAILTSPEASTMIEVGRLSKKSNSTFHAGFKLFQIQQQLQILAAKEESAGLTDDESAEAQELLAESRQLLAEINSDEVSDDVEPSETKPPRRPPIPAKVRNDVWNRDGGRCVECGSNEDIELDHIIPFSRGGSSTWRNLQILCQDCNRKKGASIG